MKGVMGKFDNLSKEDQAKYRTYLLWEISAMLSEVVMTQVIIMTVLFVVLMVISNLISASEVVFILWMFFVGAIIFEGIMLNKIKKKVFGGNVENDVMHRG